MKVAVISTVPTCGKTTFIEVLGSVYSRSQGRDVAVFSTGNASENIEMITNYTDNEALRNPYVFRAMVQNNDQGDKMLLDYGIQAGDEHVYMFDVLGSAMAEEDKEEFIIEAINTIPVDLTLVEIHGDLQSNLNTNVLNVCDCCLVLTEQSPRGFRLAGAISEKLPNPALAHNMATIISKCDPIVAGDKAMASNMKIGVNSLYRFPRSSMIAKLAYNGELDTAAYNIIIGDAELVQFRVPMLEIMQFLFDDQTRNRKVIRGIDKWYK